MSTRNGFQWTVLDLFSGAGGMSYGFHAHPSFQIIGAVDAQRGKPSSCDKSLDCNNTYEKNIGIKPFDFNLVETTPGELREALHPTLGTDNPTVLISCAPCTGYSRTNPNNHLNDDPRNSLVSRMGPFVREFLPDIFVMENVRELLNGRFSHHFDMLRSELSDLNYKVYGSIHLLNNFGLPQKRERALILAVRKGLSMRTLEDLWEGYEVSIPAQHVRRAIQALPIVAAGQVHSLDPMHVSPKIESLNLLRIGLIPKNGGSWADLRHHPQADVVLTDAMKRYLAKGDLGSHPDIYGRMHWDKTAPTIKRECAHIGNGRYAHPEQDRLCTVRELAILQGFPRGYEFSAASLANMYRHIGDAVPPLVSFQLSKVLEWILTNRRPDIESILLEKTHISNHDIVRQNSAKLKYTQLNLAS